MISIIKKYKLKIFYGLNYMFLHLHKKKNDSNFFIIILILPFFRQMKIYVLVYWENSDNIVWNFVFEQY